MTKRPSAIKPGQSLHDISARDWNAWMDMSYRHEDALASVRREIAAIRKPHDEIADRTVVVTKDPDNEVAELVVR